MKRPSAFARLFRQGRAAVIAVAIAQLPIGVGNAACISDPIRITTVPEASIVSLAPMAWSGNDYGIVWYDDRVKIPGELYFTRVQDDGTRLAPDIRATDAVAEVVGQRVYGMAWSGTRYGVVWVDFRTGFGELYYAVLDNLGNKIVNDTLVGYRPRHLPLGPWFHGVWTGDRFAFSWADMELPNVSGLGFMTFDSDGVILAAPGLIQRFPIPEQIEGHALVVVNSDLVFLWTTPTGGATRDARFLRTDSDGIALVGPVTFLTDNALALESAVWTGSEILTTYLDSLSIGPLTMTSLDLAGTRTGPDILIENPASFPGASSLYWDGTNVGVAYQAGSGWRIKFALVDPTSRTVIEVITVDGPSSDVMWRPFLGHSDKRFGVVWSDRRFGLEELFFSPIYCCTATSALAPVARICEGETITLDATASAMDECTGVPEYQFESGPTVVRAFDPAPTFALAPPASTVYTVRVRCSANIACESTTSIPVSVFPDRVPDDLGNTLRGIRSGTDVSLSWASVPTAASFNLYRGTRKETWPPALLPGLTTVTATLPDVPGPSDLYFYRVTGSSCSGVEGP